jgi:hypothetical protein
VRRTCHLKRPRPRRTAHPLSPSLIMSGNDNLSEPVDGEWRTKSGERVGKELWGGGSGVTLLWFCQTVKGCFPNEASNQNTHKMGESYSQFQPNPSPVPSVEDANWRIGTVLVLTSVFPVPLLPDGCLIQ